jgi:hypothetical protein
MGSIVKPFTFSSGGVIVASEHNDNFDTIYAEFNGGIDNDNIDGAAGISDTKLAQITTASKVHGSSLTGLASIPGAAGEIPAANLPDLASDILTTRGDILFEDASGLQRLAKGALGTVLEMGANEPAWATINQSTAKIETGNYAGTGIAHTVSVTFQPDFVIMFDDVNYLYFIASGDNQYLNGSTQQGWSAAGAIVGGGFTVGTANTSGNDNARTYYWIAFKA